ncbi:MAG TPA: L-aspartate oxidase [Ramlibacter sp.]|nr:L-aspartate oxidase [Ramlibacter sp.]
MTRDFDVIIVGSGLAGLTAAMQLAPTHRVAIITKRAMNDGSSGWAQGGIAAVMAEDDSFQSHVDDTLVAGAGLSQVDATKFVVEHAPETIDWLVQLGVPFSQEDGHLHLTREGGHSARRIVHVTDATGAAVQQTLIEHVKRTPNVTIFERHMLVDLITTRKLGMAPDEPQRCLGLYALDEDADEVITFRAPHTIVATGGAGKVYLYTTNPDTATGDGIAAAWRAGCRVTNMEFIQFHPTCLYHPLVKSFLITEAVRGEGGKLLLPDGTRFMPNHDERAELAPRDIVARAIDFEMKKHGIDCVYLDITHQPAAFIKEHFPNIHARCLDLGIDITKQPIPVVPAAHYTCGGVHTDLQGRTDLTGLHAIGETAYTGLHGANRLASNSLVECMVFARSASKDILSQRLPLPPTLPVWDESRVTDADESVVISHNWDELRRFMWDYVGIVRTNKRLERAEHRIRLLQAEIQEFYANFHVTRDLLELRNLVTVAELIVKSAQARHESRGLHFSRDYPRVTDDPKPTTLVPAH